MNVRAMFLVLLAVACTARERPEAPGPAAFGIAVPDAAVVVVGDRFGTDHGWYDSAGTVLTTALADRSSTDPLVVAVASRASLVARAPGEAEAVSVRDGVRVATHVRVVARPDDVATVDVFPTVRHQIIRGWEAAAGIGEGECDAKAYAKFRAEVLSRAVDELGITRLRVAIRSGTESPRDTWAEYKSGRITYAQWRSTWMVATNDNDDPFVADPAGFHWGFFDAHIEATVLPIRAALAARGERLFVNLNFVDFWLGAATKSFPQMKNADEWAELILVTFEHMRARFGFVPDAIEMNLEPENSAYDGADMGRAMVAAARRLRAAGFAPEFIAPSTTRAANALGYHDAMLAVPGAAGLISELSYHSYTGVSRPTRHAIRVRGRRDGIATSMLEQIGAGFDGLYEDLTVTHVGAWEQFTLAYCGRRDNPENGGVYYQVNESDPEHPRVNLTYESRLLRQVFAYVRPGAIRVGALSGDPGLRPLAFVRPDGGHIVVVRTARAGVVRLRGLPAGRYRVNHSERTGRYNVEGAPVDVGSDGLATVTVPGDAALTLFADPAVR